MFVMSGMAISCVRFVFGVILTVVIVGVVHKAITPRWMEQIARMDYANTSYISEVISYNTFQNPLHRGAALLLMASNSNKYTHTNKKMWKVVAMSISSK